jgi:hypothetical protein
MTIQTQSIMRLFNVNFATLIIRFYLLMAIVIGAFFAGYPWLALLSLPVFFISLMGIKFTMAGSVPVLKRARKTSHAGTNGVHQPAH